MSQELIQIVPLNPIWTKYGAFYHLSKSPNYIAFPQPKHQRVVFTLTTTSLAESISPCGASDQPTKNPYASA